MRGHPPQAATVSASDNKPSPIQVSRSLTPRRSGISVPEAAMPRPTDVKITPPASPRFAAGTCGSTLGAASTISTAPATPEAKRQRKNHAKGSG